MEKERCSNRFAFGLVESRIGSRVRTYHLHESGLSRCWLSLNPVQSPRILKPFLESQFFLLVKPLKSLIYRCIDLAESNNSFRGVQAFQGCPTLGAVHRDCVNQSWLKGSWVG